MQKFVLLLACLFTLTSCKSQSTLPKNLDEAILYFQQNWTRSDIDRFRNKPEKDAVLDLHFGTGMWIRNNWIRGNRDTALTNYFHSLGIDHPDNISSIILTSLHRKLNGKNINLDKQVESCKASWKPIIECQERERIRAVSNYNKFKNGDNISIYMSVDTSGGNRNAILYGCPNVEWAYDSKKDLLIQGIIVDKYFINDSSNVFFTVKIKSLNRKDTQILMNDVKVGDKKDFSLEGLKLE